MQNQEGLTPAERELETVLAGLKPHVAAMNRDRLMFQAGRASARQGQRLWQGLACSLAIILLASILVRPKRAVVAPPRRWSRTTLRPPQSHASNGLTMSDLKP